MTERCDELERRLEALEKKMLTKDDIPLIAEKTTEQVDTLFAARFGRTFARVLVWLFGITGAGLVTWLTAHGYISPQGGPPQ